MKVNYSSNVQNSSELLSCFCPSASRSAALTNEIRRGWTPLKGQTREQKVVFDPRQVKFAFNVLLTQQGLSPRAKNDMMNTDGTRRFVIVRDNV